VQLRINSNRPCISLIKAEKRCEITVPSCHMHRKDTGYLSSSKVISLSLSLFPSPQRVCSGLSTLCHFFKRQEACRCKSSPSSPFGLAASRCIYRASRSAPLYCSFPQRLCCSQTALQIVVDSGIPPVKGFTHAAPTDPNLLCFSFFISASQRLSACGASPLRA
jgi:hypothetical protein